MKKKYDKNTTKKVSSFKKYEKPSYNSIPNICINARIINGKNNFKYTN